LRVRFDGVNSTEFDERNAWRLFNAATFILTGKVVENPNTTPRLHKVMDGVCGHIA